MLPGPFQGWLKVQQPWRMSSATRLVLATYDRSLLCLSIPGQKYPFLLASSIIILHSNSIDNSQRRWYYRIRSRHFPWSRWHISYLMAAVHVVDSEDSIKNPL